MDTAAALRVPEVMFTNARCKFTGVEAFCLLLARSAGDQNDLVEKYDRCLSSISEIVNELSTVLDEKWGHYDDFDRELLLQPQQLAEYAKSICDTEATTKTA